MDALEFGDLPLLDDDVVVVGFPTGGDNVSVTRGVVTRVYIQTYNHSGAHVLAIQIDAAIKSGKRSSTTYDQFVRVSMEKIDENTKIRSVKKAHINAYTSLMKDIIGIW